MAKVIFLDEAEQEAQAHEAGVNDAQEIFRLAENLSEAELGSVGIAFLEI